MSYIRLGVGFKGTSIWHGQAEKVGMGDFLKALDSERLGRGFKAVQNVHTDESG